MSKTYIVDFYIVECKDSEIEIDFSTILNGIETSTLHCSTIYKDYPRDIFNISKRGSIYYAQSRKLRQTDLPEIGTVGRASTPLHLEQDQGVLEKNCFIYDSHNKVLAWQNNIHCSNAKTFSEIISIIANCRVSLYPILRIDAYQALLNKQAIKIKDLEITIARPSNPHLYERSEPITNRLLDLIESTGSDKLNLKLSTDTRLADSTGFLAHFNLHSIASLLGLSPKKAKITVVDQENDLEYPVDLISDRLRANCIINNNNLTTIPANVIHQELLNTYQSVREEINEIIVGIP